MSLPLHATVLSLPPFPILAVLLISLAVSSIIVLTESLINYYCTMWYGGKAMVLAKLHKEAKKVHVSLSLRHCAMLKDQELASSPYTKSPKYAAALEVVYCSCLITTKCHFLFSIRQCWSYESSGNREGGNRHPHKLKTHRLLSDSPLTLLQAPVHTVRWALRLIQQFPEQKGHKEPVALEALWSSVVVLNM